ncbi:MAG: DUF3619 family protein [Gallionella sp.]
MTSELDQGKIAQLLTQSSMQLDEDTLSKLADARHKALSRQRAHAPAAVLSGGSWAHHLVPHSANQWLVTGALVVLFLFSAEYLQHTQDQQISEIDVAILTDDLPIDVFVD